MGQTLLVTNKELVEKAKSFRQRLRDRAEETEKIRKIPLETIQELKESGLFNILRPKLYGGYQSDMKTYTECVAEISRGCSSTGWIFGLCCIRELMIAESFPKETHDEIYHSAPAEDIIFAGVFEPRKIQVKKIESGYIIENGFWPFCSGSLHASWGYFGMPIVDEKGYVIDQGLVTLPLSEVTIADDWHVMGLKGTGSNSIYMKNVFIPNHRVVSFTDAIAGMFESNHFRDISLYNSALFPSLAMSLGVPAVGIAQAALDFFTDTLENRRAANLGVEFLREATITHHQLAEATLHIETADLHFKHVAELIDAHAKSGEYMPKEERVRMLAKIGYAVQSCKDAMEIFISAIGSAVVGEGHPLQRLYRDFTALYTHRTVNPTSTRENFGRILCGFDSNTKNI